MQRQYKEVMRLSGAAAERLQQMLKEDRPIEFEIDGDEIIIKAVTQVKPECRREFVDVVRVIN